MNKKITCIGNGPVMSFTPYMAKLADVLYHSEVIVDFVTWSRDDDKTTAIDPTNVTTIPIMEEGSKENSKLKLIYLYLKWMVRLFFYFIRNKEKYFICSRFECCFPIFFLSFFKDIKYVYADRDSLHTTYKWPKPVKFILKFIETLMAKRSAVHLIPGESRRYTNYNNVIVIPNMPTSWALSKSVQIFNSRVNVFPKDKVIVYVNGWVVDVRGRKHIINSLQNKKLLQICHFIFAGNFDLELVGIINSSANVTNLGRISSEESLSYYFDSDFVVTLYDPSLEINRKAEPNKWWDCVATNTKFIANEGIDTLKLFDEAIEYIKVDYSDENSLCDYLLSLNNKIQSSKRVNCSPTFNSELWDHKFNLVLDNLLK